MFPQWYFHSKSTKHSLRWYYMWKYAKKHRGDICSICLEKVTFGYSFLVCACCINMLQRIVLPKLGKSCPVCRTDGSVGGQLDDWNPVLCQSLKFEEWQSEEQRVERMRQSRERMRQFRERMRQFRLMKEQRVEQMQKSGLMNDITEIYYSILYDCDLLEDAHDSCDRDLLEHVRLEHIKEEVYKLFLDQKRHCDTRERSCELAMTNQNKRLRRREKSREKVAARNLAQAREKAKREEEQLLALLSAEGR